MAGTQQALAIRLCGGCRERQLHPRQTQHRLLGCYLPFSMTWGARNCLFCKMQSDHDQYIFSFPNNLNSIFQCLHVTLFFPYSGHNSLLKGNDGCTVTLFVSANPYIWHGPGSKWVIRKKQKRPLTHRESKDTAYTLSKSCIKTFGAGRPISPISICLCTSVTREVSLVLTNRAMTSI